ncbi:MAG: hypothetical protein D6692_11525, partial [Planctomycetota bacterium]
MPTHIFARARQRDPSLTGQDIAEVYGAVSRAIDTGEYSDVFEGKHGKVAREIFAELTDRQVPPKEHLGEFFDGKPITPAWSRRKKLAADALFNGKQSHVIEGGDNAPDVFSKTIRLAAGLKTESDGNNDVDRFVDIFTGTIAKTNSNAFRKMRVEVHLDRSFRETVGPKRSASAAAYNPATNTLYLNFDRINETNIADVLVHESGHFAETFALGTDFTQQEWGRLGHDKRKAFFSQLTGNAYNGSESALLNDAEVRSEWVAYQFARVVRGESVDDV